MYRSIFSSSPTRSSNKLGVMHLADMATAFGDVCFRGFLGQVLQKSNSGRDLRAFLLPRNRAGKHMGSNRKGTLHPRKRTSVGCLSDVNSGPTTDASDLGLRRAQLGVPIQHHAKPIAGLNCGDGKSLLGGQSDGKAQRGIGFEPTTTFKVLQGRELVSRYIIAKVVSDLADNLHGLCRSHATYGASR